MKRKETLNKVIIVTALIVALVGLVYASYLKIKYWEYSGWYIMVNHFDESIPSIAALIVGSCLVGLSNLLEKW